MSSVIPSAKRSHLGSLPMLSNGKTAMDAFSGSGANEFHRCQAPKPASSKSKMAMIEAPRVQRCFEKTPAGSSGPCASILSKRVRFVCHWTPNLNVRCVRALRQIDANWIVLALALIVFAQLVAQPRRLDAHEWIDGGIETLRPVEDFHRDVVALESLAATGQRLGDDVFQEPLPAP